MNRIGGPNQINYNVALGLMKNPLVDLFVGENPAVIYQYLIGSPKRKQISQAY